MLKDQTALQRAYEPFQRIEFLKGIMTNLPTQSSITATTAPGANPLGQTLGAGLGATLHITYSNRGNMDKVLTRKMFRKRYFKYHKPKNIMLVV